MAIYRDEKKKDWYLKFRYTDWQGKAHNTTKRGFKTKREALEYEYEFKQNAQATINVKVSTLIEKYLADKKMRIKISNYNVIESTLKNHLLKYLGSFKISDITPAVMIEWQNKLIAQKYKNNTLKRIHVTVSSLFNYAVKYFGMKENPFRIIGSFGKINKEAQKINFWKYEEFEQFIKYVKKDKHKICFKILFFGGLRTGELLALDKQDFNFIDNKITITKNKLQCTCEISTPKTPESEREVDMPCEIMREIEVYIKNLQEIPSPLFNITHSALLSVLKICADKAGVKKIRLHDLRHSHVSHLIHLGVPITTISRRLGHKSPKITLDVYSHMYEESGKKAAELLSHVIQNGKKNNP